MYKSYTVNIGSNIHPVEPRGSDKADFEGTISSFYRQIDKVEHEPDNEGRDGALFFAVISEMCNKN